MLKKIGISVAAIFAVVALAKPPAAMAADRDDYGRDARVSRDYHEYRKHADHRRFERRDRDDRGRDWR